MAVTRPTRGPTIEFYEGLNGRWYWRRRAANGKLTSGARGGAANGYSRRDTCRAAARRDNPGLPLVFIDRRTALARGLVSGKRVGR
jgi:hypothetical protein